MLVCVHICGSKRLSCLASHQEAGRCSNRAKIGIWIHTGFETKLGETSPEVQNRDISGLTRKDLCSLKLTRLKVLNISVADVLIT